MSAPTDSLFVGEAVVVAKAEVLELRRQLDATEKEAHQRLHNLSVFEKKCAALSKALQISEKAREETERRCRGLEEGHHSSVCCREEMVCKAQLCLLQNELLSCQQTVRQTNEAFEEKAETQSFQRRCR
eukprot:GHVS01102239.1.p1 GENE.GHVS01102239.1~~GHVS01102239.1.p1  ORF type:complete len:129 (+),score=22.58 GHVS01102239.1:84-470(+)